MFHQDELITVMPAAATIAVAGPNTEGTGEAANGAAAGRDKCYGSRHSRHTGIEVVLQLKMM